MGRYSRESEGPTSASSEPDSNAPGKSSSTRGAGTSSNSTSPESRSTKTSERSEPNSLRSISSSEAFLARTLARLGLGPKVFGAVALDCGPKWRGWSLYYDRSTSSWRTSQASLLKESTSYSGPWPLAGTMRNGRVWAQPTLGLPTFADASSSSRTGQDPRTLFNSRSVMPGGGSGRWATATKGDAKKSGGRLGNPDSKANPGVSLTDQACRSGRPLPEICEHGSACDLWLNPRFVAWLMGFPSTWLTSTDGPPRSRHLETLRSRKSVSGSDDG